MFSFCVCPGGQVVAAASEAGRVVTNGMSELARDGENINGGLLVSVTPEDFGGTDVLAGVAFQRRLEEAAYALGGGGYAAPAQMVGDFLAHRPSIGPGRVTPTYRPAVRWCDLHDCLPPFVCAALEGAAAAGEKAARLCRARRGAHRGRDALQLPRAHRARRYLSNRSARALSLRRGRRLCRRHSLRCGGRNALRGTNYKGRSLSMAKKIGVIIDFLNDKYERQLNATAAKYGYEVSIFPRPLRRSAMWTSARSSTATVLAKVVKVRKSLKWYCTCWAGVNHFCDESLYQNPDCRLTNSSGAYGTTISEHLIMVCLMLLRRQMEYTEVIRAGGWEMLPGGIRSLHGARITVLGTGDIGTRLPAVRRPSIPRASPACAARSSPPTRLHRHSRHRGAGQRPARNGYPCHGAALPRRRPWASSRERIALLPDSAFVVNVGRGTAIDQEALCDALNAGQLAGAALDVVVPEPLPADHPLRRAKNLLLTPHVAGNMTLGYTCDKSVQMFCDDLENYAAGRPLAHLVDRKRGY